MSFGVGLGAFVQGVGTGMRAREVFDQRRERRADRQALRDIDTDARRKFDQSVQAGEVQPDEYGSFWIDYALPRYQAEMMRQGRMTEARALQEWGQSEDALQGGRLFASALAKAQTGNIGGAVDDAIAAGKIKGYLDHDYELVDKTELRDENGVVVGYRLKIKTGDKTVEQDVANEDVARVVASLANPEVAWETQKARRKEDQKFRREIEKEERAHNRRLELERAKAGNKIDPERKAYSDAMKIVNEDPRSFQMSPEQKDEAARALLQQGKQYSAESRAPAAGIVARPPAQRQPAQTGRRVIVDTQTGEARPADGGARTTPKTDRLPRAPGIMVRPEELQRSRLNQ